MCQKGARAEGRVAVPTGRLCKARFEVKYLPVLGPSGQGRVGDRSRRRQAHRACRRVGPTPGNAGKPGGAARRRLGRPARPQTEERGGLLGGAVVPQPYVLGTCHGIESPITPGGWNPRVHTRRACWLLVP